MHDIPIWIMSYKLLVLFQCIFRVVGAILFVDRMLHVIYLCSLSLLKLATFPPAVYLDSVRFFGCTPCKFLCIKMLLWMQKLWTSVFFSVGATALHAIRCELSCRISVYVLALKQSAAFEFSGHFKDGHRGDLV